ncbi:branched-chain amino acid ABC transporter permease [Pseudorhodoplanes sp.]|uniref:branched-chain amino acid ABC transporter permease n=1 Tax=Pseudorhodoplanes sp. TaxID=1934341 RepID=UPI00391D000F
MSFAFLAEQSFNALQLGLMLFLMAVGVTLAFGTMRLINLAHGSFFMLAAYFYAYFMSQTKSAVAAWLGALVGLAALAIVIERLIIRPLYLRDHLEQVLATFGLILVFNDLVMMIWGRDPVYVPLPDVLSGHVMLGEIAYPTYRLIITAVAIVIGLAIWYLIARTRTGGLIRASADNRVVVQALGANVDYLGAGVFALVALLAGIAGIMTAPLIAVTSGMGDSVLIQSLVVVIIGGLGSVIGALVGALLVAFVEVFGRTYLPFALGNTAGFALANMSIYLLMAITLVWRPFGIFGKPR